MEETFMQSILRRKGGKKQVNIYKHKCKISPTNSSVLQIGWTENFIRFLFLSMFFEPIENKCGTICSWFSFDIFSLDTLIKRVLINSNSKKKNIYCFRWMKTIITVIFIFLTLQFLYFTFKYYFLLRNLCTWA